MKSFKLFESLFLQHFLVLVILQNFQSFCICDFHRLLKFKRTYGWRIAKLRTTSQILNLYWFWNLTFVEDGSRWFNSPPIVQNRHFPLHIRALHILIHSNIAPIVVTHIDIITLILPTYWLRTLAKATLFVFLIILGIETLVYSYLFIDSIPEFWWLTSTLMSKQIAMNQVSL